MQISVVTVCFNAEAHIEQCLRSVSDQTHRDIQHIVIDGASTDRTVDIVRRFPHVAVLSSEQDKGIYDAMNKGLARVTGDFVLYLNADDTFASSASLSDAVAHIKRKPGGDVYYGWLEVRPLDGDAVVFRPSPPEDSAALMVCGCLPHQSTLARPTVFEKTGPFDIKYRYHADYDWFLKILHDPTIDVRAIPCVVGSFKEGGASSQLAKGQPEAYAIQNASPLYSGSEWDKRRIEEYQKTLLNERLENARLREQLRGLRSKFQSGNEGMGESSNQVAMSQSIVPPPSVGALRARLESRLPKFAVAALRSMRVRKWL